MSHPYEEILDIPEDAPAPRLPAERIGPEGSEIERQPYEDVQDPHQVLEDRDEVSAFIQ